MRLFRLVALHVVLLLILCVLSESVKDPNKKSKGPPYWPNPKTGERIYWEKLAKTNLLSKLNYYEPMMKGIKPPKNVILFIGDGMGITSVTIARRFKNQLDESSKNLNEPLSFEKFRHSGFSRTSSYDFHVTDSAAGAMALLSGRKVVQNTLGIKPSAENLSCSNRNSTIKNTIADLAIKKGISVGLVTTDSVTGATPAAMYAKLAHRSYENQAPGKCHDIAEQLLSDPASKFKVIMGGGSMHFYPAKNKTLIKEMRLKNTDSKSRSESVKFCKNKGKSKEKGCRVDKQDIVEKWKETNGKGRKLFVDNKADFNKLKDNFQKGDRVLGLFARHTMNYYMDTKFPGAYKPSDQPTLTEMSEQAVKIMEEDSPDGYFLLIEGAQIDKALHANLATLSTYEIIQFAEAIEKVRSMTDPEETLILVTADHSHALSMPGYLQQGQNVLQYNDRTAGMHFATGPNEKDEVPKIMKDDLENSNFQHPRHIKTKTSRHGGEDVGIWADGPFSWLFTGSLENTEVAYYMKCLLNLTKNNPITFVGGESAEVKGQNVDTTTQTIEPSTQTTESTTQTIESTTQTTESTTQTVESTTQTVESTTQTTESTTQTTESTTQTTESTTQTVKSTTEKGDSDEQNGNSNDQDVDPDDEIEEDGPMALEALPLISDEGFNFAVKFWSVAAAMVMMLVL